MLGRFYFRVNQRGPTLDKEVVDGIQKGAAALSAFGIAALAGLINYLQRFAGESPPPWRWLVFSIKGLTAGFAGLACHWLLSGWHVDSSYINFFIAVAGWGGAETIVLFQQIFQDGIRRAASASENDKPKS